MSILEDLTAAETMYADWAETGSPSECSTTEAGLNLKQTRKWIADLRAGTATEADIKAAQREAWDLERTAHGWAPIGSIGRYGLDEFDDDDDEEELSERAIAWAESRMALPPDHRWHLDESSIPVVVHDEKCRTLFAWEQTDQEGGTR